MDKATGDKQKTYTGEYVAQVVSVSDPEGYMRVQVRVRDLFDGIPDADLPWATYKLPPGSRPNDGFFIPVDEGDWVWVDFPFGGDSRRPRITGSVHYCPDTLPSFPHESFSGAESYSHKRTGPQLTPSATGYHRDVVLAQHGVLIEVVSGTSEVRITQKKSGSAVEIDAEGNVTAHSENNLYGSSVNNTEVDVGVDLKARVANDALAEVGNNMTCTIANNMTCDVGNKATINAATSATINAPQINLLGNLSATGQGGGTATEVKSANTQHTGNTEQEGDYILTGNCTIDGALTVTGTITAPYFDGTAREADDN
jgi:hypothetical protein